jgi:hypothetical protein
VAAFLGDLDKKFGRLRLGPKSGLSAELLGLAGGSFAALEDDTARKKSWEAAGCYMPRQQSGADLAQELSNARAGLEAAARWQPGQLTVADQHQGVIQRCLAHAHQVHRAM